MDEKIQEFKSQNFIKPKVSAVYGIYSRSGECLWIGETENLYSRLDKHYHSSRRSTIRGCVERDNSANLSVDELWEKTLLKTLVVTDTDERKKLEKQLIEEIEPRYNRRTEAREQQTQKESSGGSYSIPDTFRNFVLNWDWPDPPKPGTRQAQNVIGVIYRLMAMNDFSSGAFTTALKNRADEARSANPSLGDRYEATVRDSCVRGLGFKERNATKETATKDFLSECRELVREYEKRYR